jgi:nucleoside-diphosphate-sugar epimerase
MKIVVTGGSGHAGRSVVQDLVEHGYDVLVVDRQPPANNSISNKMCELEDFGQAVAALQGAQAVIHFAAIPRPTYFPWHVVFRTNILSCYNVFEAAAVLGIERVIYASSISVTGYPFYERFFEPSYLPIDEEHLPAPQDAYGLSKYLGEQVAEAFVRRTGMTVISLRMPWIHTPDTFDKEIVPFRAQAQFGASNLWLYIDSRDVAQACRLSLNVPLKGHHIFYIAAPDTFMETPSMELASAFYPHAEIRPGLVGRASLVSSQKAQQILGFQAQFTWENYAF